VASIAADPQFVNYRDDGSGDYHLQSRSPALHSGTASAGKSESDVGIGATLASNGRRPILR
jgi:hypothetical protein